MWWIRWTAKDESAQQPASCSALFLRSTLAAANFMMVSFFCGAYGAMCFNRFRLFVSGPTRPAHKMFAPPAGLCLCHGNRPLKDGRGKPWSGTLAMQCYAYGHSWIYIYIYMYAFICLFVYLFIYLFKRWHRWTCNFLTCQTTDFLVSLAVMIVFQLLFQSLMLGKP